MNWKICKDYFSYSRINTATEADTKYDKMNHQNVTALLKLNANDAKEFLCGSASGFISITVTYPIYKVMFRQMLEDVPTTTAVRQLSHEGVRLLYRGILPPLCLRTLSVSLMFGGYEGCKRRLHVLTENKTFSHVVAANFAGACDAIFMPFERVQTLLQDRGYHDKFRNTPHAFGILLREYGVLECYRGLVPILFRNGMLTLTYFTLTEQSKRYLRDENSLFTSFISGGLIGGFSSCVFFPLNVVKVHMQSKIGGDFEKFTKCVRDVYIARDRSILSFYKGVHLNFVRTFIGWGVVTASHDFIKRLLS